MVETILAQVAPFLVAVLATQAVAQFVVNLTPTPADDRIVGKIYGVIEKIAGIWTSAAKEFPGERDEFADQ